MSGFYAGDAAATAMGRVHHLPSTVLFLGAPEVAPKKILLLGAGPDKAGFMRDAREAVGHFAEEGRDVSTIGADFCQTINRDVQVWDTAGQERFFGSAGSEMTFGGRYFAAMNAICLFGGNAFAEKFMACLVRLGLAHRSCPVTYAANEGLTDQQYVTTVSSLLELIKSAPADVEALVVPGAV